MHLRKMDLNHHNPYKIGELIYEADAETFDFFFGNKKSASRKLGKLVKIGENNLGNEHTYVVTNDDQEIMGVLVCSAGKRMGTISEFKFFAGNFNLIDAFKLAMIEIIDSIFLSDLEEEDFYYAIVAVDESARGRGIGSFILEEGIKMAREKGCRRAVLDVDIENEGALRLYERSGFKKFKERIISLFGWKKGAYNMEYVL
ncbi:N-acetyltransferase [Methanobacterium sp. BAmetb5]|uniref:GNAT family N-acetyltransferase n=1 Tax=Methanobacterium sp. BAmetb5 TaxID=2025351 RepID=UPI000E8FB3F6|nr:GNAT family N-acetyltransferase [Methanobacterium sp. BAmetb5]AXV40288.1 MAG: GNAT family N-acetyltransferase [Methanobacterium sp. BAmetb5]